MNQIQEPMERLSDVSDLASMLEEQARAAQIQASRHAASKTRTGVCQWCDSPVPATALYCDQYCREDHQKHIWASKQKPG